jgi:hypothetical protein
MRTMLALVALLYSGAVIAQQSPSPTVGDKPLLQVKPHGAAGSKAAAAPKNQSVAQKLLACLDIDDGTKDRLNCYDGIFPPKPNPKAPAAKAVADCHLIKEEDDRLNCYNGFAEKLPKS